MSPVCAPGGSAPKLGTALAVGVGSARIAQLLVEAGMAELNPALAFIAVPEILTQSFCASDPPPMQAMTAAESSAVVNLNFGPDFESGIAKVPAVLLNQLWDDLCQCNNGLATIPLPPVLPTSTPVTLAPNPSAATGCASMCFPDQGQGYGPCVMQWGPNASLIGQLNALAPVGTTPSATTVDWNVVAGPGPAPALTLTVQYNKSGGPAINHPFNYAAGTNTIHIVDAWPDPTYTGVQVNAQYGPTGGIVQVNGTINVWCGGVPPGGVQQPCCPPDTATQATLDAILKMVTLLQRYKVPFAYQLGAVHSGLPQQGSFTVSGLLGLKLDVVQTVDSRPILPGTPPYYWDQGWCSVLDGNGFIQETRLSRSSQVWFPTIMQDATTVGWWLNPNTQLTITEIEAEA